MSDIGRSSRGIVARGGAAILRIGTALGVVAGLAVAGPASADTGLQVYAGYMDTHTVATSPAQPDPWPYTDPSRYIGTPCPDYGSTNACWDASAIRLVNNGATDITGVHVKVVMGSHNYDLWGASLTVKAGSDLVLTETGASPNSENFDGSDFSPNAYNGGLTASCANSGAYPVVYVTIGATTTSYDDTGQVLNDGGVDGGHCENGVFVPGRMDESHQWALLGTAPAGGGGGTAQPTAPTAPQNLKAVAGDGSVTLSWSAPASDGGSAVTGYRVLRGTTSGGQTLLTTVASTSTTYTSSGLSNGTTYYFTVEAVNATGASAPSNEASGTPQAPAPPPPATGGTQPPPSTGGSNPPPSSGASTPPALSAPSAPTGLTATGGDGLVRLSWAAPSSDGGSPVTGYQVYRGTVAGGGTALVQVSGTGFVDTGVVNGRTYFYSVAATNSVGASDGSPEVSATPQATAAPGPGPAPGHSNGPGVCAGVRGCRVMVRADIDGDGHRDVVAMARRGGRPGTRGALVLRVQTAPGQFVQTRRRLVSWAGSPWVGVSRLDRHRGKEIVVGRRTSGAIDAFQVLTWRAGRLVLLDAPGPGRWWTVERSDAVRAGWQRRAVDPVGVVRQRVALQPSHSGGYAGEVGVYRWTRTGWQLVRTRMLSDLALDRAMRWGGFQVPGLRRR